jgi:hypothetical protein
VVEIIIICFVRFSDGGFAVAGPDIPHVCWAMLDYLVTIIAHPSSINIAPSNVQHSVNMTLLFSEEPGYAFH